MIAKHVKGRGFRGCLNYLLKKPEAQLIGGNMLGETARELAAEFSESRKLRPNLTRAVYHASLSLAPGESFSDEKWRTVAKDYVTKMGFEGSQFVIVRHKDAPHDHVHIVASRIRLDGSTVSDSKDHKRAEKIVRGLEIEHGLTRVKSSHEVPHRAPTGDELRKTLRTGEPSHRMQLQGLVDHAISGNPGVSEFFSKLESMGVEPIPNVAKTGHVSGISFRLDGQIMKGSDLGKGYSWQGLQKRGMTYGREGNQERDDKAISQRVEREKTYGHRARGSEGAALSSSVRESSVLRESGRDVKNHEASRQLDGGIGASKQADTHRHEGQRPSLSKRIGESLERIPTSGRKSERRGTHDDVAALGGGRPGRDIKRPSDASHIQSLAEILLHGKSRNQLEEERQVEEQRKKEREDRERRRQEERSRTKSRGRDDGRGGGLSR
jgi:hypothetical protein